MEDNKKCPSVHQHWTGLKQITIANSISYSREIIKEQKLVAKHSYFGKVPGFRQYLKAQLLLLNEEVIAP